MLPKINRLKKNKDFEQVLKRGQFFRQDFLTLKILPNKLKNNRFGFIVSSKVSKKAVLRNKIKRRLRALILSQLNELNKIPVLADIVIIAKPGAERKSFQEFQQAVDKIFKKTICYISHYLIF